MERNPYKKHLSKNPKVSDINFSKSKVKVKYT